VEILAMMQIQNVFNPFDNRHAAEVTKRKFAAEEGDHLSYLNVYTCFVEVIYWLLHLAKRNFRMANLRSGVEITMSTTKV
jgi:hypothetical protein